jgi:hypothetical protein
VTDVAVVVADLTGNSARTVETVRIAAARTKADAEIVAVGHGHRPDCAADSSLEALPLGGAYVRNRGLALVSAPIVAFVDGGLVVPATPAELLARLPSELAGTLPAQPQPHSHSHPAKTRFSYSVGPDLMLHLQGNPLSRLERAVRERETIRRRASVGGIPKLVASAEAPDAVWLLEERLPGRHPDTAAADEWFDAAADWAVGMAGPPGPPLDEVPSWAEYRRALVDFAPPEIRERVEQAVEAVSELRAVHMHGDLQPLNLVVEDGIVGAIDWEGAWLEGLPGLDLLFLALFADGAGPDVAVLERLARGEDLPRRALVPRLRRLGIEPELLPDLVVASLAVWALSERRRLARLGSPSRPPVFLPLLRRFSA